MSRLFTVIVAQADPAASLNRAIAAVDRACTGLNAEIVVVQNSQCPLPGSLTSRTPLTAIRMAAPALTPQLWAAGLEIAQGDFVAFTLANCEVAEVWAQQVIAALQAGAKGVGGPLDRAPRLGWVDTAVYFLRYSAFLPQRIADQDVVEIAGDNAAYIRASLLRYRNLLADGFWEVTIHRELRGEGGRLCTRTGARSQFCGGVSLWHAVRHRFAHGRHFGAWRAGSGLRAGWQIVLAAPIVPWLLGLRVAARVWRYPEHRRPLLTSVPALLIIAAAWAAGEAVGVLFGAGLPRVAAAAGSIHVGQDSESPAACAR